MPKNALSCFETFFFNLSLFIALFFITVGFLGKNTKGFKDYRFSLSDREFLNVLHKKNYAYVLKKFEDLKNKEWDNDPNTQNIILVLYVFLLFGKSTATACRATFCIMIMN